MEQLKSCLALVGLLLLLAVGSCVWGVRSVGTKINETINPQDVEMTLQRPSDEVSKQFYYFMDGVSRSSAFGPSKIESLKDGTLEVRVGAAKPYALVLGAKFFAENGGKATRVVVHYDATPFAASENRELGAMRVHNAIKQQVIRALSAIDEGRAVQQDLSLQRIHDEMFSDTPGLFKRLSTDADDLSRQQGYDSGGF